MKIYKIITGLFLLIFLMNCKDNNNREVENSTYPETSNDRSVRDATNNYDENNRTRNNINAADSINNVAENNRTDGNGNNGNVNAADNNRMNKMFSDLNFTSEQIENYNTRFRKDMEDWRKNNASADISAEEHRRMEDRHMKSFLSPAQYQQYQKWINDNPVENQR